MQLMRRQPDGQPLRAHLLAGAAACGQADPRLTMRPPELASALWQAFVDLASARPVGMAPGAVPPSEIAAWQQLHGVQLSPWEVETLQAMDRAALSVMADNHSVGSAP
jgi:hypothetical protein